MGSGGTKIEKPNIATQEEESGGLHVFEFHLPTAGAGVLIFLLVLLLLWCTIPVLKRWRRASRPRHHRGPSPRFGPPINLHSPWPSASFTPHPALMAPPPMASRFQELPTQGTHQPSAPNPKKPTGGNEDNSSPRENFKWS